MSKSTITILREDIKKMILENCSYSEIISKHKTLNNYNRPYEFLDSLKEELRGELNEENKKQLELKNARIIVAKHCDSCDSYLTDQTKTFCNVKCKDEYIKLINQEWMF